MVSARLGRQVDFGWSLSSALILYCDIQCPLVKEECTQSWTSWVCYFWHWGRPHTVGNPQRVSVTGCQKGVKVFGLVGNSGETLRKQYLTLLDAARIDAVRKPGKLYWVSSQILSKKRGGQSCGWPRSSRPSFARADGGGVGAIWSRLWFGQCSYFVCGQTRFWEVLFLSQFVMTGVALPHVYVLWPSCSRGALQASV